MTSLTSHNDIVNESKLMSHMILLLWQQIGLVDLEINWLTKVLFLATVVLSVSLLALKVWEWNLQNGITSTIQ